MSIVYESGKRMAMGCDINSGLFAFSPSLLGSRVHSLPLFVEHENFKAIAWATRSSNFFLSTILFARGANIEVHIIRVYVFAKSKPNTRRLLIMDGIETYHI